MVFCWLGGETGWHEEMGFCWNACFSWCLSFTSKFRVYRWSAGSWQGTLDCNRVFLKTLFATYVFVYCKVLTPVGTVKGMYILWLYNWLMQVFKGKKMAGHMGAVRRTVKNVWIYKIEPERDLMWVRGQVCVPVLTLFSFMSYVLEQLLLCAVLQQSLQNILFLCTLPSQS